MKTGKIKLSERQKTSVVIDPELWQQVRVAAVTRGVDRAVAVEEGLRLWMAEQPASDLDGLSKSDRALAVHLIDALRDTTRSQQDRDDLATGIKYLLRVFERRNAGHR